MSTALFIIALVGFVGRIVISAKNLRRWGIVIVLAILAGTIGSLAELTLAPAFPWIEQTFGMAAALPYCLLMIAIGYGVPTLLRAAERRSVKWQAPALLLAMFSAFVAFDVWSTVGGVVFLWAFLSPPMCFVGGMIAYLIFRARFWETDGGEDVEPMRRRM